MSEKLLFIYNPHSGKGIIKQNLSDIMDVFIKNNYDVSIYATQSRGDAIRKARESAPLYDRIICSGGDGTLNEVINGIMKTDAAPVVGYIPAGSTNDFGNSLELDGDMVRAAKIAASHNYERQIDMGRFNDDYFVYVAAFGIFTEVSYQTDQLLKNFFGHAAYVFEAIKSLQDVPVIPLQVEADGNVLRGDFIYGMVTNAVQVGGIKDFIKGDVKLDDGLFEVMLIRSPRNPIELTEIGSFLTNIRKDSNLVHCFRANTIKFTSNKEVRWTLDGEYGGSLETVQIVNEKKCIKMSLAPVKALEDKKEGSAK